MGNSTSEPHLFDSAQKIRNLIILNVLRVIIFNESSFLHDKLIKLIKKLFLYVYVCSLAPGEATKLSLTL